MNYLLSAFTGLGNFILQTPLIRAIHQFDKDAWIDLISDNRYGALDVLRGSPLIRTAYKVPRKIRLIDVLRAFSWNNRNKFDVIFLPFSSSPSWLQWVAYVSSSKLVVQHINITHLGIRDRLKLTFKPKKVRFVPVLQGRHEINLNLDLFEAFCNKPIKRDYQTVISYKLDPKIREKHKIPYEYICLQVGAANGLETPKRWPLDYFSRLVDLFQKKYPNTDIVIVGDKGEFETHVKPILSRHPNLINTAGNTTINDLANILAGAKLVISHDSGIMHMADALGVKLIALYGPTDHTRTSPLGSTSFIIRNNIPCSPCMYNFGTSEKLANIKCPEPECMYSIKPEDVMAKINEIFEKN